MKRFFGFLVLLCLFFRVAAQENNNKDIKRKGLGAVATGTSLRPLRVGDLVPDVRLDRVLNNGDKVLHLADFRGKLLVIDFWATSCGSCIQAMPCLESLQKEFSDQVQILPVSGEKTLRVATFLKNNPTGKTMTLPVVAGDTRLHELFPHRIMSHEVWIGGDGKVLAITGPEYVNAKNIRQALSGSLHLPVKTDRMAFDYNRPLFGADQLPLFYSAVGNFKAGVASRFGATLDSANAKIRTYMFNFPLLKMYMMSIGHLLYFPKTMMDIRLSDSSRINVPSGTYKDEWKERSNWCYESILPAGTSESRRMEIMREDLNRFFKLNGRLEKRQVTCLSLERSGVNKIPVSKGGSPQNTLHGTARYKELVNDTLLDFIWELNEVSGGLPAVDNTGFTSNVDMCLELQSFKDTKAVNQALLPYGLTLKEKIQELEFFVLTDAGN